MNFFRYILYEILQSLYVIALFFAYYQSTTHSRPLAAKADFEMPLGIRTAWKPTRPALALAYSPHDGAIPLYKLPFILIQVFVAFALLRLIRYFAFAFPCLLLLCFFFALRF